LTVHAALDRERLALTDVILYAQTSDGGFDKALSSSLAATAKAMHATIRRDIAEAATTISTREHRKGSTVQLFTVSVTGSNNMALRWKCDSFAMWQAIAA